MVTPTPVSFTETPISVSSVVGGAFPSRRDGVLPHVARPSSDRTAPTATEILWTAVASPLITVSAKGRCDVLPSRAGAAFGGKMLNQLPNVREGRQVIRPWSNSFGRPIKSKSPACDGAFRQTPPGTVGGGGKIRAFVQQSNKLNPDSFRRRRTDLVDISQAEEIFPSQATP